MTQRGAIFGLDVRMAIVIGGLMAVALSTEMLSDFEGDRTLKTEKRLEQVRDALLGRYSDSATTTFTSTLGTLFSAGYLETNDAYYAQQVSDQGAVDAWGSNLTVNVVSNTKTIMGASVTSHFGILLSPGPDKVYQTATSIANESAFQTWAPTGDDVGLKFNTVLLDRDRVVRMQNQLKRIMEAITTYAQRAEATMVTACTASTCNCTPGTGACSTTCTAASPTVPYCDRTGDTYYYPLEEKFYNFYPTDSVESAASAASSMPWAYSQVRSFTTYTSGNLASMQALMTLVGLPTSFASDPWGRTLRYDSNEYDVAVIAASTATTAAPLGYTASVWYQ